MDLFKWFKKSPVVPRGSLAVFNLAAKRGVKVDDLNLKDKKTLQELKELGLTLSTDGTFYYDDPVALSKSRDKSVQELGGSLFSGANTSNNSCCGGGCHTGKK